MCIMAYFLTSHAFCFMKYFMCLVVRFHFSVTLFLFNRVRFHWILNFAISPIQISLNLNPTNYLNNVDFPMTAYTREFIKLKYVNN